MDKKTLNLLLTCLILSVFFHVGQSLAMFEEFKDNSEEIVAERDKVSKNTTPTTTLKQQNQEFFQIYQQEIMKPFELIPAEETSGTEAHSKAGSPTNSIEANAGEPATAKPFWKRPVNIVSLLLLLIFIAAINIFFGHKNDQNMDLWESKTTNS